MLCPRSLGLEEGDRLVARQEADRLVQESLSRSNNGSRLALPRCRWSAGGRVWAEVVQKALSAGVAMARRAAGIQP